MATGLTVSDDDISVGGRTVAGANLGRVSVGALTHTSDTALATQASGGTAMATKSSVVIPSAGTIRLTIEEIEMDEGGTGVSDVAFGLNVGNVGVVWAMGDDSAGATVDVGPTINSSVASYTFNAGVSSNKTQAAGMEKTTIYTFDIAGSGWGSVGTGDIVVQMGDQGNSTSGEVTVTGTTTTARFLVEIIDGS